jgi:hypothetical protein
MEPINKMNAKMKNLIGIIDEPIYEDLLFEIVQYLDNLKRYDGEFLKREVSLFTRVRIKPDVVEDLDELIKLGYIEKGKYSSYIILKHLWE